MGRPRGAPLMTPRRSVATGRLMIYDTLMRTRRPNADRGSPRVGLWMIGACGGVGSTVALGIAALAKGLSTATGLVTELPEFRHAGLVDPSTIAIGGHEVRNQTMLEAVREAHGRGGLFDGELVRTCTPWLRQVQRHIRPGTLFGAGKTIRDLADRSVATRDRTAAAAVRRLSSDIAAFRKAKRLDHVVVVNVASSEPPTKPAAAHRSYAALVKALAKPGSRCVPSSSIYALAAIEAGCPFINFTPSAAISIPAVRERAEALGLPYMGNDGKTGESLVKSFLAPMFASRNLAVLSWVGQNILGNRDGEVLADPKTRASKIKSKERVLSHLSGKQTTTRVSIDYVPSLVDWKVAWDFIHFEGFLGTKMNMQFTWQGSDSILAAPLVLDLVRLAVREVQRGTVGPMKHLACFFKDPLEADSADHFEQWRSLVEHAAEAPVQ